MGPANVRVFGGAGGPPARPRRAVALVLLATLPLSSCYSLAPVQGDPAPRSQVTVRLTPQGAVDLAPVLGQEVQALDGTVEGFRGDTLELLVRSVDLRGGGFALRNGDYAAVPRSAVASLEERRLNRGRSWLLAGTITVGALVLGRIIGSVAIFGGGDGGNVPVPPN